MSKALWNTIARLEEARVRELGDAIGYGRMMQLAEQIWNEQMPGAAHSVGCCTASLVPCPAPEHPYQSCDWCCGACRVTKRVAQAIEAEKARTP